MIYNKLKNAEEFYSLGEKMKLGFEFLKNSDLKSLPQGKHTILGEEIYANVQVIKTKPLEEKRWEVHRDYIDIQYVISGQEKMGFGILEDFREVVEEYDKQKDVAFLNGGKYNYINVQEGEFTVFYPSDVHAPMLAVGEPVEIKKVIVKIKI